MHDQFEATRQAMLGRSIVEAIQEEEQMATTVQERIGRAIMQVSQAQESYEGAKAAQQTQLASAAIAAVRTEALMELALSEDMPGERSVAAHHSSATADISRGSLLLACLGLISLFVGGLAFGNRKSDVESIPIWKLETLLQLQRSGR